MRKFFNYIAKMRRWKQVMLVLVLWCVWGLVDVNNWQKAPLRDAATFKSYQDSAGKVVRLSDEVSAPFKVIGRTMASFEAQKGSNVQYKYYEPVKLFPTVLDCLQKSEWNKPNPDLTKFDWNRINGTGSEEANVCLFRIASSYEKPDDMKKWFELQGFSDVVLKKNKGTYSDLTGDQTVSGIWKPRQQGFLYYPNFTVKLLQEITAYVIGGAVNYDINGNVAGVDCSANYL